MPLPKESALPQSDAEDNCENSIPYLPSFFLYRIKDFGISSVANATDPSPSADERYFFVTAEIVAVSASNIPTISLILIF